MKTWSKQNMIPWFLSINLISILLMNNFTPGNFFRNFVSNFWIDCWIFNMFKSRNEHLFQAEGHILPKIHEWWKEENFYSTSDGREIINNFGCITRFLINANAKNSAGDSQRKPLKIHLPHSKIYLTALHILPRLSLNKIPFRKTLVDSWCQQFAAWKCWQNILEWWHVIFLAGTRTFKSRLFREIASKVDNWITLEQMKELDFFMIQHQVKNSENLQEFLDETLKRTIFENCF